MKKIIYLVFVILFSLCLIGCNQSSEEGKKVEVKLGIDLIDENLDLFYGKRVGLITNPTGVNNCKSYDNNL